VVTVVTVLIMVVVMVVTVLLKSAPHKHAAAVQEHHQHEATAHLQAKQGQIILSHSLFQQRLRRSDYRQEIVYHIAVLSISAEQVPSASGLCFASQFERLHVKSEGLGCASACELGN
jgi:hypothetical protein